METCFFFFPSGKINQNDPLRCCGISLCHTNDYVALRHWFSDRQFAPQGGCLAMSGDTLGCHILGEGLSTGIYVSEGARDAAELPTMQGPSPTTELSGPHGQ